LIDVFEKLTEGEMAEDKYPSVKEAKMVVDLRLVG